MLQVDDNGAFGGVEAGIFLRPGSTLGRRPIFTGSLVSGSPCLTESAHVSIEDREQTELRATHTAVGIC